MFQTDDWLTVRAASEVPHRSRWVDCVNRSIRFRRDPGEHFESASEACPTDGVRRPWSEGDAWDESARECPGGVDRADGTSWLTDGGNGRKVCLAETVLAGLSQDTVTVLDCDA